MEKCEGITKRGAPCGAPAGTDGLCFFHRHPEKARLLGQVGGRKNRQQLPEPPTGPSSARDLLNILAEAISGVRSKTLTPRAGSAISQLCNAMKSVLSTADLEDTVERLRQQVAEERDTVERIGQQLAEQQDTVARLLQQLAEQERAVADRSDGRTNGSAFAGEDPAEQPLEAEASAFADAGQPLEGQRRRSRGQR